MNFLPFPLLIFSFADQLVSYDEFDLSSVEESFALFEQTASPPQSLVDAQRHRGNNVPFAALLQPIWWVLSS
jgi:hypothetical protein